MCEFVKTIGVNGIEGYINDVGIKIKEFIFIGEIGLTGELQHTRGILPMLIHAKNIGIKNIVLPLKSLEEAKLVKGLNLIIKMLWGKI